RIHRRLGALEEAKGLNLSTENIRDYMGGTSDLDTEDEKYMGLVRAKIRLARLVSVTSYGGERARAPMTLGSLTGLVMTMLSESGSVDTKMDPFNLADYVIYQVVYPMDLEPLIRELPAYYRAIVQDEDWEEKFDTLLSEGKYGPDLDGGKAFHELGFPVVNKDPKYVEPLYVSLADSDFALQEVDGAIEGWLYSFWMRRYNEGSMNVVKRILDWLNVRLDEAAGAKG
ncbi:MAG TPA: hypothetical protein DIC53_02650, partial [Synergistaceae bacterium]|nr:hypothetical protein [Synergistaceae bacterium]